MWPSKASCRLSSGLERKLLDLGSQTAGQWVIIESSIVTHLFEDFRTLHIDIFESEDDL